MTTHKDKVLKILSEVYYMNMTEEMAFEAIDKLYEDYYGEKFTRALGEKQLEIGTHNDNDCDGCTAYAGGYNACHDNARKEWDSE